MFEWYRLPAEDRWLGAAAEVNERLDDTLQWGELQHAEGEPGWCMSPSIECDLVCLIWLL